MTDNVNNCQICQNDNLLKPVIDLDQDIIKFVFANVTFNENYLICQKCIGDIQDIFDVKKVFLRYEETAEIKVEDDIRLENRDLKCNFNVCIICLDRLQDPAGIININQPDVKHMFEKCFPEMDLDVIKCPISCENCLRLLERYFHILCCLEVIKRMKEEPDFDDYTEVGESCAEVLKQEEIEVKEEPHDDMYGSVTTLVDPGAPNNHILSTHKLIKKVSHLSKHLLTSSAEQNIKLSNKLSLYKCPKCSFTAARNTKVNRHIWNVHGIYEILPSLKPKQHGNVIEPYKCAHCTYKTKRKTHLIRHLNTHKISEKYKCSECTFTAINETLLKTHLFTHQLSDKVIHKCLKCAYQTKKLYHLKRHFLTHNAIDMLPNCYKCKKCDFQGKRKECLKRHLLTHKTNEDLLEYKCSQCPYVAKQKAHLKTHISTHSALKKLKCSSCPYQTTHKSHFSTHLLTHKHFL